MSLCVVNGLFLLLAACVTVWHRTECATLISPIILKADVKSSTEIELEWQDLLRKPKRKFRDRKFYTVKYYKTENQDIPLFKRTKRLSIKLKGLLPDTNYSIAVKTTKGKRESDWSDVVVTKTSPPADIASLKAIPLSSTAIQLIWQAPKKHDNSSYGYEIFWQEAKKDESPRRIIISDSETSHTFNNLIPDRLYSFQVQTLSDRKDELKSDTVFVKTLSDRPIKPPRGISVNVINSRVVEVRWNLPPPRKRNGNIVVYTIQYRKKSTGRGDLCVVNILPQPREYNLTGLTAGARYKVRIAAKTVNGTGPFSKWMSFDLPKRSSSDRNSRMTSHKGKKQDSFMSLLLSHHQSPESEITSHPDVKSPEKLVATPLSSTSVQLSWSKPETEPCCPVIAYRILVRDVQAGQWERDQVTGTKTQAVVKDLQPDTEYAFNITAYNTHGSSEPSHEVFTTTLPAVEPVIDPIKKGVFVENQGGSLRCVAHGDPAPEVFWYREGSSQPFHQDTAVNLLNHKIHQVTLETIKSGKSVEKILHFSHLSQRDSGIYICLARNAAGNVSMTTVLEVNVIPSIINVHDTWVKLGSSTNMTCAVKGIPLPTVTWIRLRDLAELREGPKSNGRMGRLHVRTWIDELQNIVYKTLFFTRVRVTDKGNYSCTAVNKYGSSVSIAQLQIEVPPPPPVENVHAIALSPSKVSIFWTRPSGYSHHISAYRLTYSREDDNSNDVSVNVTTQSFEIDNLEPETTYKLKVTAFGSHGNGTESKTVRVKTLPNKNLEPANLSAKPLNSSIIQLDWEPPKSISRMYIKGYHIYYKRETDDIPVKLFVAGNTNKRFLIGLGKEDTYSLRIATVMTWGTEWPSQWIKIKKKLTPPNPPRNLTALVTTTSITLSWQPPLWTDKVESQHTGYKFAYGMKSRNELKEWNISEKVTNLTLVNLVPGTIYNVSLQATNEDGKSDTVQKLIKTLDVPPGPVLNAVASALSSTEILVQWIAPKKGAVTRYHVRYWRRGKRDKESAWLFHPNSQYIAGSLRKNSEYRFEIIPYNNEEAGETTVTYATTMVDRPEEPPRSVKINFINASAVTVHWEPPRKEYQNGPIAGYKIVFKLKGGKRLATYSVDGNRRNYTFKGLEASQTYKVHVAAMTAKGAGPYSKWVIATTDKTAPESPTRIQLISTSNSITVWWSKPRNIGVPVNGYILGYGRYIPEVFRIILGPNVHIYTIEKLRQNSEYIISVRAFNDIGESHPIFLVGKTKKDMKATFPLNAPVNVQAETLSHSEIKLSWVDPSLGKLQKQVDGRYYLIRFSAVSNDIYQFVNATKSPFVIGNLMVFTKYEFSVRAVRGNDHSGWSLPQFSKTFLAAPFDAPRELTLLTDSNNPTSLTLTWLPPKTPNGIIEEYFLYQTSDPSLELKYWVVETISGTKLMKTIHNMTPHTRLYFRIQARNVAGYGPLSEIIIYSPLRESTAAPSNVRVSALNTNRSTSVEVSWDVPEKPTSHIAGYIVYYRELTPDVEADENDTDDLSWMVHDERGLSTVILDLEYNMTYEFKVGARYSGGFGPVSEVVMYTTPVKDEEMMESKENIYEDDVSDSVPMSPSEITAEGATNSIRLAWVAPPVNRSAEVEFYRLGYGELFPNSTQIDVNATESFYIIENLTPNTMYSVSVEAANSHGSSEPVITTVMTTS